MSKKLYIVGAGGFAREVKSHVEYTGDECTLILSDDIKSIIDGVFVIAIGDPVMREKIAAENRQAEFVSIRKHGYETKGYVFGRGVIICPGTIITTNVTIGHHVIINLNCTVGHDSVIGDFCTLAPGVHVSGNVTIGKRCQIGSGTVIREKISICDDVIIGCGSVVVKDITEPGTYVGNPVKKIK